MIIIVGCLFLLAVLFYAFEKWFDHAGMNLMVYVRVLLFAALILLAVKWYIEKG